MTNSVLSAAMNGAIVGTLLVATVRAALLLTPRRVFGSAARYAVWWATLVAISVLPLAYLPSRLDGRPDVASRPTRARAKTAAAPLSASTRMPVARVRQDAVRLEFPVVLTVGSWLHWIVLAWACAAGLMLFRLAASCFLLQRRKSGACAAPAELRERIDAALATSGSSRRAAVLRSPTVATPVLAGLWRPAILIPERLFAELTEEELAQIGLHEAAHLARCDDYALVAQRAIEGLLPFHPAVRWVAGQIDLERELACDDIVVENVGAPRTYAACLVRVMELCNGERTSWTAAGVIGDRSQLTRRVDRLLDRNRGTDPRPRKGRLMAAVGVVATLALLAGRTPRAVALAMSQATAEVPQVARPQTPKMPQTLQPVIVPVEVQDLVHRYVTGLTKESFQIFEDGVEQQISDVAVENPPLLVEVVIDASGSMRNQREIVETAVLNLMKSANPASQFSVANFNDDVMRLSVEPGNDADQIVNKLRAVQPHGGTAIRDAILQAAEEKYPDYPERMLVVISDGEPDDASSVAMDEFRARIFAASIPIWAITLASQPSWLHELADLTSGHEFSTDDASQVAGVAASLANRTRYILKYIPNNQTLDGTRRRVNVSVPSAPPGTFKVRHRMYYYATGR